MVVCLQNWEADPGGTKISSHPVTKRYLYCTYRYKFSILIPGSVRGRTAVEQEHFYNGVNKEQNCRMFQSFLN